MYVMLPRAYCFCVDEDENVVARHGARVCYVEVGRLILRGCSCHESRNVVGRSAHEPQKKKSKILCVCGSLSGRRHGAVVVVLRYRWGGGVFLSRRKRKTSKLHPFPVAVSSHQQLLRAPPGRLTSLSVPGPASLFHNTLTTPVFSSLAALRAPCSMRVPPNLSVRC